MPYGDPDPTDPSILVGVLLPGRPDTMREMATVFADEFARFGFPAWQIVALFRDPFYGGAHAAFRALGEDAVGEIVEQAVARWPRVSIVDAPEHGPAREHATGPERSDAAEREES